MSTDGGNVDSNELDNLSVVCNRDRNGIEFVRQIGSRLDSIRYDSEWRMESHLNRIPLILMMICLLSTYTPNKKKAYTIRH